MNSNITDRYNDDICIKINYFNEGNGVSIDYSVSYSPKMFFLHSSINKSRNIAKVTAINKTELTFQTRR